MLEQIFFLNVSEIVKISFLLFSLSFILFFLNKLIFIKKDITKIAIGSLVFVLLSLIIHYQVGSGTGMANGYGWPHDFYNLWISLDNTESHPEFSLIYFLANIIFYFSFLFFLFTLFKSVNINTGKFAILILAKRIILSLLSFIILISAISYGVYDKYFAVRGVASYQELGQRYMKTLAWRNKNAVKELVCSAINDQEVDKKIDETINKYKDADFSQSIISYPLGAESILPYAVEIANIKLGANTLTETAPITLLDQKWCLEFGIIPVNPVNALKIPLSRPPGR